MNDIYLSQTQIKLGFVGFGAKFAFKHSSGNVHKTPQVLQ